MTLEAGSLERLTTGSGNDTGVALSRDGRYAAFTAQADSLRAWLFPLDAAADHGRRSPSHCRDDGGPVHGVCAGWTSDRLFAAECWFAHLGVLD